MYSLAASAGKTARPGRQSLPSPHLERRIPRRDEVEGALGRKSEKALSNFFFPAFSEQTLDQLEEATMDPRRGRAPLISTESLILAQDERWRRA